MKSFTVVVCSNVAGEYENENGIVCSNVAGEYENENGILCSNVAGEYGNEFEYMSRRGVQPNERQTEEVYAK